MRHLIPILMKSAVDYTSPERTQEARVGADAAMSMINDLITNAPPGADIDELLGGTSEPDESDNVNEAMRKYFEQQEQQVGRTGLLDDPKFHELVGSMMESEGRLGKIFRKRRIKNEVRKLLEESAWDEATDRARYFDMPYEEVDEDEPLPTPDPKHKDLPKIAELLLFTKGIYPGHKNYEQLLQNEIKDVLANWEYYSTWGHPGMTTEYKKADVMAGMLKQAFFGTTPEKPQWMSAPTKPSWMRGYQPESPGIRNQLLGLLLGVKPTAVQDTRSMMDVLSRIMGFFRGMGADRAPNPVSNPYQRTGGFDLSSLFGGR